MSSSISPKARNCVAVAWLPLTHARLLPWVSTLRLKSKVSETSKPASSSTACACAGQSNSADTSQRVAPSRTAPESARSPNAICRASIRMDLPAPVSPVSTLKPCERFKSSSRTMTKSRKLMCRKAMAYTPPSFQCIFLRKVSK